MIWDWTPQKQDSGDVIRADALPESGESIPDPEYFVLKKPNRMRQFTAEGLTEAEYEAIAAQLTNVVSVTDQNGRTHTGIAVGLSSAERPGGEYHDDVTLTVRVL